MLKPSPHALSWRHLRALWQQSCFLWRYSFLSVGGLFGYSWIIFFQSKQLNEFLICLLLTGLFIGMILHVIQTMQQRPFWINPICYEIWGQLSLADQRKIASIYHVIDQYPPTVKTYGPIQPFDEKVESFIGGPLRPHPLACQGHIALITLAGGVASRLGIDIPKGCLPISPLLKKSLFALQASYLEGIYLAHGIHPHWAIMTSESTHVKTLEHFETNAFFGLNRHKIHFFKQENLPISDEQGRLFLQPNGELLQSPDGNGAVFHQLHRAGLWELFQRENIGAVSLIPIDNPLSYPFDYQLIQSLKPSENVHVVSAVVQRLDSSEKVGVFAIGTSTTSQFPGRYRVLEYSEIPLNEAISCNSSGKLIYDAANIGVFVWSNDAINHILKFDINQLPWHIAHKTHSLAEQKIPILKRERFIFDWLAFFPITWQIRLISYPRKWIFSPIKSSSDIENTQEALIWRNREQLKSILQNELGDCILDSSILELGSKAWDTHFFDSIRKNPSIAQESSSPTL